MPRVDDRRVLSGIVPALKSGGRWSDCPEHVYGPKNTLYNRFRRWAKRGVRERIYADFAEIDNVPSRLSIYSSCVKVHRTTAGANEVPWLVISASPKAGRYTKLHAICDEKGRPHVFLLTPAIHTTQRWPCWRSMPCRPRTIWSRTKATTATPCAHG